MAGRILVIGSLNMDLVARTPRHPEAGETILASSLDTYPGGKGANQAVAAARMGAAVKMVGCVGVDAFGQALRDNLARERVDVRHLLQRADAPTGMALITVNDQGQNTIVVVPGANWLLTPADLSAAEEAFLDTDVVVLQLETPLPTVERAIDLARRHGAWTVLNPAPAQPLSPALLSAADCLIPNRSELRLLTGLEQVDAAMAHLQRKVRVRCLVVTLGDGGVLILDAGQRFTIPAHQVPVVDTTAAGDAFVGAFAVAISEGGRAYDAARWGNAAGALAVMRVGAQPSLPRRREVEQLLSTGCARRYDGDVD
jgi:ribokinase